MSKKGEVEMIVRGDSVKHGFIMNCISLFFKGMKKYRQAIFVVKRIEDNLVVYEVGGKEYKVHPILLKKVN